MTSDIDNTVRLGRRSTLRFVGALAGVGLLSSLGTTLAHAEQPGAVSGMGATPPMGDMLAMMDGMRGMMGGLTGPNSDRIFIQEMIPHHQSAVSMATMAWGQAEHPEIKQLAETIVRSQNAEIEQMAAWYRAWFGGSVPPGQMPSMMASMGMPASMMVEAKPVDKTFLEMMSMHHQMAVMMASMALGAYQKPELGSLEQSIVADQAKEIAQMRAWHLVWYPAG